MGEKPKGYDLADYVLGHFTQDEQKTLRESAGQAARAVRLLVQGDVDKAMNDYNKKVRGAEGDGV